MPPLTARRLLLLACVLGSLWLFYGCGAMPDTWDQYATLQPLPAVVMRVSAEEVQARCQRRNVMGCAIRDYAHGVCVIYTDREPLPETIPHELLHCAGVEHV